MKTLIKMFQDVVCVVLIGQLAGCGTLMYPERRGQKAGRLDIGVTILDGLGLLLFLIPGVIAFAVDFSNGTIYLPRGSARSLDLHNMRQVKFDPKHFTTASLEDIIQRETGRKIRLDQENIEISRLDSLDDLPRTNTIRLALNTN